MSYYLPNSIERCAPIVGFDPYAFIMDQPSNLQINKMQNPYDVDYYAVGPKNSDSKEADVPSQKKEKKGVGTVLKAGAAVVSGIALIVLLKRGWNKIGKIFHKGNSSNAPKNGKISKFLNTAQKNIKKGWESVKNFVITKFQDIKKHFKNNP